MAAITDAEHQEIAALVAAQNQQTIEQDAAGTSIRMATLTCPCGRERAVLFMFQCLYCNVWFCKQCAEEHFDQTVAEYAAENPVEDTSEKD